MVNLIVYDCQLTYTTQVSFAFCDHRELMTYNAFNVSNPSPSINKANLFRSIQFVPGRLPDTSLFERPDFHEVFRTLTFKMHVIAVKEDSRFEAPVIFYEGEMQGYTAKMEGSAFRMPDGNVHWSFVQLILDPLKAKAHMICRYRVKLET